MNIKPFQMNEFAGIDLGMIEGSREELVGLRDVIDRLLKMDDDRVASIGIEFSGGNSGNQGLSVRKVKE